ncbi:MAG: ParB N-terminal domain-containing protein, partial [Pseudolabrys sp.]
MKMDPQTPPVQTKTSGKPAPSIQIKLTDVLIPERARALQPETVTAIENSFDAVGQLQPIVVRAGESPTRYVLVAGNHRLEAARRLKWETIAAAVVD